MGLKIRGYDTLGNIVYRDLEGGTYDVNVQLIAVLPNKEKSYRLNENECRQTISLYENQIQQTNFLNLECTIQIYSFSKNTNYKLVVQVSKSEKEEHSRPLPFHSV